MPRSDVLTAANNRNAPRKAKLEFSDSNPGKSGDQEIAIMKNAVADSTRNCHDEVCGRWSSGFIRPVRKRDLFDGSKAHGTPHAVAKQHVGKIA